jgi:hypothetical protein
MVSLNKSNDQNHFQVDEPNGNGYSKPPNFKEAVLDANFL